MSILDVNVNDIFNAIGGGSPLSIIDSILYPSYVIRNHGDSSVALEFSGMASVQPSANASVINAPVEKGKYQSINKVKRPGRVICEVVLNGLTGFSGGTPNIFDLTLTSQSSSLEVIKTMIDSTKLYDIDTPKGVFEGYDLVDYSYQVNSKRGITLLVVHLTFQEVMQQMEVVLSGSQIGGQCPINTDKNSSGTGLDAPPRKGGITGAKVDDLQSSWGNLKDAVNKTTKAVTDKISSGFTSSVNTVKEPLIDTATSVTKKITKLVSSIKDAIT